MSARVIATIIKTEKYLRAIADLTGDELRSSAGDISDVCSCLADDLESLCDHLNGIGDQDDEDDEEGEEKDGC